MSSNLAYCRRFGVGTTAALISSLVFSVALNAQEATLTNPDGLPFPDPLASNNGLIPSTVEYAGPLNASNLEYPTVLVPSGWEPGGGFGMELNAENAAAYMQRLKDFLEPDMRILVENHRAWNAEEAGWYNTMWRGQGTFGKGLTGREAIMNTNTGQIVPNTSWAEAHRPTPAYTQNYGVIYYNRTAAYTLGQVYENIYEPDPSKMNFPDGSIVVKIEASTVQPAQWPWDEPKAGYSVLTDAAEWRVFRPTTEDQVRMRNDKTFEADVVPQSVYPFQLAIKVKDPIAAPETGWVFLGYVYDARSEGEGAWDRFTAAGLMWGNDPKYNDTFDGRPPEGQELEQTWVNDLAPDFVKDTMGWGGRFAAPMDVAVRHGVKFPLASNEDPPGDGFRVSSCLSCHGTAQSPYSDNLYPAPDTEFPADGEDFYLHAPGKEDWQRWFQNRPGDVAMTDGAYPLDYDLSNMLALMLANRDFYAEANIVEFMNGH